MIDPTIDDIGRAVTYRDPSAMRVESGFITSFNIHYVFVRYGAYGTTEAATQREHLEWLEPKEASSASTNTSRTAARSKSSATSMPGQRLRQPSA